MTTSREILCCRTTLEILRTLCMIPPKGRELKPDKLFFLKWALLMIITSVTLIGSCLHFIMSIKANIYIHLDVDIAIITSMITVYIFSIYYFYKAKSSIQLYMHLSDFEEYGKPINYDKNNELFDKMSFYHYIYLECLVLSILILSSVIKSDECKRENLQYGIHEVCGLFAYTWMPFDIDYVPAKQIYICLQLFGTHYIYMVAGIISWIVVETVQHIIVRIRHAKFLFLDAIQEKDSKKQREKFSRAVRYHKTVLGLEDLLNEIFGMLMISHLALSAPILGTAVFAILHGGSGSSLFICVGCLFALTMDCISGQRLQNECIDVATAIYDSEWYNCNEDIKKDIWFVLMRCRMPMNLQARSFGAMNHVALLGVLKAAYSYVTLLTQVE
nr:odorant receptor [Semanotus bifasciatus]